MKSRYDQMFECPLEPAAQGPEFELILTCCRPKPSEAHYRRQQELAAAGLDTRKVVTLGTRHKISPLLYCNLRRHPAGTFDDELLDKLAEQYEGNKQRAFQVLRATHELMRAEPELRFIVLKGLDVASRAYGDLAARHVGDIDILVDPEQLDDVLMVLKSLQWELNKPELFFSVNRWILLRSRHDWLLTKKGVPHMELHWRALHNPFEFMIDDSVITPVAKGFGLGSHSLNNENLVIYLCLHGSKHQWGRLKWLFDLPNVLDAHEIDWSYVWQQADKFGAGLAVQQGLLLAQKYCSIELAEEAKRGFNDRIKLSDWEVIHTYQQDPNHWLAQPHRHPWLNRFLTVKKINALCWYGIAIFLPNIDDYEVLKLPAYLHPLYFLLRPFLWFIRKLRLR